jgi:hypothetical protein
MSSPIKLPSGKIVDLNRFVALFPTDKTSEYDLILEGYANPISLEQTDADALLPFLFEETSDLDDSKTSRNGWDREEQIRKNQPAMKLLKEHIERLKKEQPTPEKEAAFEEFKKIIDAERPVGQKLYENK